MASGGGHQGYGYGGSGGSSGVPPGACDSLNYLDVLKEVYSSLSFPGVVPDAGMAPGNNSRDGLESAHAAAAAAGGILLDPNPGSMPPPPLPPMPPSHDDDSSYAAMDEDGGPPSQQRRAYRDRKRRLGASGGGGGKRAGAEEEEEEEEDSDAAGQLPEGSTGEEEEEEDGQDTPRSGKGKGLFLPPRHPTTSGSSSSNRRTARRASSPAPSEASTTTGGGRRRRRQAALKAEAMLQEQALGGGLGRGYGEEEGEGYGEEEGEGGEMEGEEEEEIDEALMNLQLPTQFETDFVGAVFKLGLKSSSPKVLMEHMPNTETLTTEHIKSHLQKYRLHSNRSKDEFVEYFNGYLRGPFAAFCARRGWEQGGLNSRADLAAFAAIPHHPDYVAPGDRMHHMRQVQALTGQLLQGQLELQAQVQNYITSQIAIQADLLSDVVHSSLRALPPPPPPALPHGKATPSPPSQQPIIETSPPMRECGYGDSMALLVEEARALESMGMDPPSSPEASPPNPKTTTMGGGKRRPSAAAAARGKHAAHKGGGVGAGTGAVSGSGSRLPRGVTAV